MSTMGSTGGGAPASTGGAAASTGAAAASTGGSVTVTSTPASTGAAMHSTIASTGVAANDFKWSDGWRERLAGGDQKTLQRLGRFADPEAIWKSYGELERRMSSGELRSVLPANARPEELAAWRKENGIPEKAADYLAQIQFDDGIKFEGAEKAIVDAFLERAHQANMSPAHVKAALTWWTQSNDAQIDALNAKDAEAAKTTQDALRAVWVGPDYRMNLNAIDNLLAAGPAIKAEDGATIPFRDFLFNARLPDGRPIGSSPEALQWLARLSRELNPAATVVPSTVANQGQAIADEIAKFKAMMGNRQSEYWKGPKAEANQKRYRELVAAQEALDKKAKRAA